MSSKLRFIQKDCDPSLAQDRSLPDTAYLVEYIEGDIHKFDIVMAGKKVDIFDHYWDEYRDDFVTMNQSEGRANPKLWDPNPKPAKESKRRK